MAKDLWAWLHSERGNGMEVEYLSWDEATGQFSVAKPHCVEKQTSRSPPTARFLKGPIPMAWLERAATLPGKCLAVSLCLWRLKGLKEDCRVWLTNDEAARLGVDRYAKSRALKHLQQANLVEVERRRGRIPCVTIKLIGDE